MEKLGLIAGNGRFPILFAKGAQENKVSIIAVGIEGETSPEIEQYVEKLYWIGVAQIGKLIKIFKSEQISKAVMAGGITKTKMFSSWRNLRLMPDIRTINLWYRHLKKRDDHSLLGAVAEELRKDGIELQNSTLFVPQLLAQKGILTKKQPTEKELEDVLFGWPIAKEISRLGIGQCLVIKEKVVLAVEALEGTDEAILRGGILGKGDIIVIKVSKQDFDPRFDIPTVGTETIKSLKESSASVLALEAGKTLILDIEETIKAADNARIAIVGL
ncbi:MAG: LpxI family protein [Candidatus Loosdrechtia sp.]|uniref:LpxI family protein n=1 Tax=Candidatus Loosdrechtia sp. TaxID=3101272 RepID=UPI003A64294C|nr:MAG: UDP-2,3-diacylglucosamine diphosphatase LpxI [Candidatus Jettenia sp. AMX2]